MLRVILLFAFIITSCATVPGNGPDSTPADRDQSTRTKRPGCDEGQAFERGFNQAMAQEPMSSAFAQQCDEAQRSEVIRSYQQGYKDGIAAHSAKTAPLIVQVSPHAANSVRAKCSDFARFDSCFDLDGEDQGFCEVCKENRSCFTSLDVPDRKYCEAYRENASCFMSFNSDRERNWCSHLKEGLPCKQVFRGQELKNCLQGIIPDKHYFWRN